MLTNDFKGFDAAIRTEGRDGQHNSVQYQFLLDQGIPPGQLEDMWQLWLESEGYTGAVAEMAKQWALNEWAFGGGGPALAPVLTLPVDNADGQTAATGSVSTDTGNGTLYWVVTQSATKPTTLQVEAGEDHTGSAASASGSQAVAGTGVQTLSPAPSGLSAATGYFIHFMHKNTGGLRSSVSSGDGFTTESAAVYTMSEFDNNGNAYMQQAGTTNGDGPRLEFSVWVTPQTLSGNTRLWATQSGCFIGFDGDEVQVFLEDSAGATIYNDSSVGQNLVTGTQYHIHVACDLVADTMEVRVDGTLANAMSTTLAANSGLLETNQQWGIFANRVGGFQSDVVWGDYWLATGSDALVGYTTFYNGGTPPDLTGVGNPDVWLGGNQTAINLNNYENLGDKVLSAGNANFAVAGANTVAKSYGANTLAGAGQLTAPAGATAIADAGGTNLSMSGGVVTPATDGVTSGTVTFTGSVEEWAVTADAGEYSVASMTEMSAALTDSANTGRTIRFRDGDYSGALTTLTQTPTVETIIDGDTYRGATLGHMVLDACTNLSFRNLKIYREFLTNKTAVISMQNAPDTIKFRFCEIYSDDLATTDFDTLGDSNYVTGISASPSTALTPNLEVYGCHLHDLEQSMLVNGNGITVQGNYIEDMVASSYFFGGGDDHVFKDNDGEGLGLSTTSDGGGVTAHQALNGYGTLLNSDNMQVIGNRLFATDRRFTYRADTHSSGVRGFNIDDPAPPAPHTNLTMHHNVFVSSTADALALEQFTSGNVYYNTTSRDALASQLVTGGGNPIAKFEDSDGLIIRGNIANVSDGSGALAPTMYAESYLNVPSYEWSGFTGPLTATELNLSNYEALLTPKPSSYWEGKGAIGTNFVFATGQGTNAYSPSVDTSTIPTKPGTATATGQTVTQAAYNEDATLDQLTAPSSSFAPQSGNQFTLAMGFQLNDDAAVFSYPFYATGGGQAVWIRRTSNGILSLRVGDLLNITLPGRYYVADGFVNLLFTMDATTGEYRYAINGEVFDMVEAVTDYTDGTILNSWFTSMYVGASSGAGANATDMNLGYLWLDTVFVDLDTQANLDVWLAQDGGAPNFSATGTLTGFTQPVHFIEGSNIGANAGDNAGSGANWTVTGSPAAVGGGGGSYTQTLFDTQGTAYMQDATFAHTDQATLEFSAWITPQSVTGTQRLLELRNASYIGLSGDQLAVRIEDSAGTAALLEVSDAGLFTIGTQYHIYVSVDLASGGNGSCTIRVNNALPAGMSETLAANTGLVESTLQWGILAERAGGSLSDVHFGDYWLETGGTINGVSTFYNGGTPPDLTGVGTPEVWLGGDQTVANLNAFANKGSLTLSAGSATFAAVGATTFILKEDGDALLKEDGDNLLLE